jgi:hypothetical protein
MLQEELPETSQKSFADVKGCPEAKVRLGCDPSSSLLVIALHVKFTNASASGAATLNPEFANLRCLVPARRSWRRWWHVWRRRSA